MTSATGDRTIAASVERIRAILLDPIALPSWNPAFVSVQGAPTAIVGANYTLATIQGLRGVFTYTTIEPHEIRLDWSVPGLREVCGWTLQTTDAGTLVTHDVERSGPMAFAMRGALAGLPKLRLDRLEETAVAH